jgi:signal transduction histidine kinase
VPTAATALWSLFVAGIVSLTIVLAAFVAALVIAQRRRLAAQQEYATRIFNAQEEERAHIARELHDDALQRIAILRHELDRLADAAAEGPADRATRMRALTDELADLGATLRRLAQRLHPTIVEQLGLPGALRELVGEVRRSTGLEVRLEVPEEITGVQPATAHAAYRIVQEALRNVAKHAGVAAAEVQVSVAPRALDVRVRDRGRGFDPEINGRGGLGLPGMRERAVLVHGKLAVLARPGEGTTVTAQLPREAT